MKKIAISLSKGGVGKTTTAVTLAHGLSLTGKKVLLIDTDTQGQAAFALGAAPKHGLAEVVSGDIKAELATTEVRDNLFLLSGGRNIAQISMVIAKRSMGIESAVKEALKPLEGLFDYVIMDMAPGWDIISINTLIYVDEVLAPCALEIASVQGLLEFINRLDDVKAYNEKLALKYILPTFHDKRLKRSVEILEQLKGNFKEKVCNTIRQDVRLSECMGYGKTIFEYAPDSRGAEDYRKLIKTVTK